METFYFQGRPIAESKRDAVASIFGHLTYEISETTFTLKDSYAGRSSDQITWKYNIESNTDTSVTLALKGDLAPKSLTLYRVSEDALFVKSGSNLEYFKRIAA